MSTVDINNLLRRATQVRDAYENEENTAERVGSILIDLIKLCGTSLGELASNISTSSNHADSAFTLDPDSPVWGMFLSKLKNDTAKGYITFEQGISVAAMALLSGGWQTKDFVSGLWAGKGGAVDALGNAEFESLKVRGPMWVMELIFNRLRAIEGDQLLTEGDTIERVVDNGDGTYGLYLREKWEGYFTAQAEGNVLKGIVNTLASGSGTYYTSWMRVNSVNTADNYINVTLYPDDEVPAGKNFPPAESMNFARWGNQTDETRQSCIYMSSTEGRIAILTGVTKPIIEDYNWGACFGTPPEFLKASSLPLVDGEMYIYVRGLISQDILHVNKQGKPMPTYVDRGQWDATADYYCEDTNPDTDTFETSEVWYKGCKYRCMSTGTHDAPGWATTDWMMTEGNPNFTIDFAEHELYWRGDTFNATLTLIASLYNQDITASVSGANVAWTRESYDAAGARRAASDNAWTPTTDSDNKRLLLTTADLDWDGVDGSISKIVFCCTASIDDATVATAEMDYEF